MKRAAPLLALLLAAALLLSGCSAMLERSYSSVDTHVDYPVVEDESVLRAETYQGLVNSILYYINEHSTLGSIRLYNYSGDVETDLEQACAEVVEQDPMAAYAVSELSYEYTRILTYYEVDVRVSYAHTAAEMENIRRVSGTTGLRTEIARIIEEQQEQSVFLLSYFSGDEGALMELFQRVRLSHPQLWLFPAGGPLEMEVTFYPETGTRRVTEVDLRWYFTAEEVADYARQLEELVTQLLMANPPASERYTVEELAAIARAAAGPVDSHGTDMALYTLSGEPATELGLLLAMEYLCQRTGVEVVPVVGQTYGRWLIVATPEGYRHLLPQDYAPVEENEDGEGNGDGEPWTLRLYTDEELSALGYYNWNSNLYPACVDLIVEDTSAPDRVEE